MIRELTKSALSFSWALSLLGAEQAINLFRPGQQNRDNVFAPMAQVAASQLDESMKGIYRTGDSMQRELVDMAFSLVNPSVWVNPGAWTRMTGAASPERRAGNDGIGAGIASMMNPRNWMNPANFMRSMTDRAPAAGERPQNGQSPDPSPGQYSGQATGAPSVGTPVTNESAAAGWGPMPSDS